MLLQPPSWTLPATREVPVNSWLECIDLSLQRSGRAVLDRVSMRCARGEWVALVDDGGDAAAALFAVIEGRCRPRAGELRWARGARPAMSVVLGELCWPSELRLCELLDALALPRSLPLLTTLGLERLLPRPLGDLPAIEARIVQLAIADVQPTEALLLDDPLQGLADDAARQLTVLLASLRRRWPQALVRIPDDSTLLRVCDRRVRLDRGRICRDAPARAGLRVVGDLSRQSAVG